MNHRATVLSNKRNDSNRCRRNLMCGIVALIHAGDSENNTERLAQANASLRHRGPDQSSEYTFENCLLGHSRLSIVDIAGGSQPLFSEDKNLVLIANGEIYNHNALRHRLEERGHRFYTHSDCEVILHLFEEDPENYLLQLDGMFAFLLLDRRNRCLSAARDRVGIKPLYFARRDGEIGIASEIRALFAAGIVAPQLDPVAVSDALTFNLTPGRTTIFSGIELVPAGTELKILLRTREVRERKYWKPTISAERREQSFEHCRDELALVLREAVESHRLGDVPIGSYLSGGIDSTILALLLAQSLPQSNALRTFSLSFQDARYDESEIINATLRSLSTNSEIHPALPVTGSRFASTIGVLEQSQMAPHDAPLLQLAERVRATGLKMVLSGEGADELLGGYNQFHTVAPGRTELESFSSEPVDASVQELFAFLGSSSFLHESAVNVAGRISTEALRWLRFRPARFADWVSYSVLKQTLLQDPGRSSLERDAPFGRSFEDTCSRNLHLSSFDRSLLWELEERLPNYVFPRVDKIGMAHSIEIRVPFVSNRMLGIGLTLPPEHKYADGTEKYVLRKAFEAVLPTHMHSVRKKAFTAPTLDLWRDGDSVVDAMLSEPYLRRVGLFRPAGVSAALKLLRAAQPPTAASSILSHLLTGVLSVQLLHATFVDRNANLHEENRACIR